MTETTMIEGTASVTPRVSGGEAIVRGDVIVRAATIASVVALALIAAVVSYRHMRELALLHGESEWTAALIPWSVDGMIVASSMSILLASRSGQRGGWLPWTLLVMASLASLAANVAVAEPSLVGRVVAAWPSFALVGAYELLMGQLRSSCGSGRRESKDHEDGAPPCPPPSGSHGRDLQRRAWNWALAQSAIEGHLPTGQEIAANFGRRDRWGRMVKQVGLSGGFGAEVGAARTRTSGSAGAGPESLELAPRT